MENKNKNAQENSGMKGFYRLFIAFVMLAGSTPLSAGVIDVFETVTPSGSGVELTFRVVNNSIFDIKAFAVGNDSAQPFLTLAEEDPAWTGYAILTRADTSSVWAVDNTGMFPGSTSPDISWMSNASSLAGNTKAFYFYNPVDYGNIASEGGTREFTAWAESPNSPLIVLGLDTNNGNSQVVLSGLHTTVVPLPPALVLFGTGLLGVGFMRMRSPARQKTG